MILKNRLKRNPEPQLSSLGPSRKQLARTGFLLNKAAQRIRELYEDALNPMKLSTKHAGVLLILEERGSISQHELGKCAYIDRTTIVNLIDDMEKLGLVERKAHPLDRRSHAIYLTAKGKGLLPLIDKNAVEAEKKFLAALSAQEQKNLVQTLRKLVSSHYTVSKESR
jgi:DNA-binding MarR family transcriptional regulator